MKRLRWVGLGLIAFLVLGSFPISLPRTLELVDPNGAPHATAYIGYLYEGGRPNPVHPITYQDKPLALARADSSGRVAIPIAFHAHLPFPIATHPSLRVACVYVPRAHNALGQMNERSPSRPGVFELDTVRRAVIYDVSDRPELWQGSLMDLAWLIQRIVQRRPGERPLRDTDPDTAALTRELIGHFRQEYDSFLTRYGSVPRPMPGMAPDEPWTTADEKRRRREAHEASFAREPLWGQLISRRLGGELKALGELERELAQP
jgi:hypothetical protein